MKIPEALRLILLTLLFTFIAGISAIITIIVLVKGENVEVPDLKGKRVDEAIDILSQKGLFMKKIAQYHPSVPEREVFLQDPPPKTMIKKNKKVKVFISLGAQRTMTPVLKGKTLRAVGIELSERGLSIGVISQTSTDEEPGTIIAQEPSPNTEVKRGTSVNLLVSTGRRGEEWIMPDLIGERAEKVIPWLEINGFKVAPIKNIPYQGVERGVILRQIPLPGWKLRKSQFISLEVSS
ncbi:MAG: PASTA domain-containing protein [Candidatus Aminicenantia bacterium]